MREECGTQQIEHMHTFLCKTSKVHVNNFDGLHRGRLIPAAVSLHTFGREEPKYIAMVCVCACVCVCVGEMAV